MRKDSLQETIRVDGLRIITKRLPWTKKFRLAVAAMAGSAYDPTHQEGLYHLFEHMCFKGTPSRDVNRLRDQMDRYLSYSNAQTGHLETTYYGEGACTNAGIVCDIILDIYLHSIFPVDELEREKRVVTCEIARDWDNDQMRTLFMVWDMLWRNNPQRRFGVGTRAGVTLVTREDLLTAQAKWYQPANTVIVAVGNVNHAMLLEKADQLIPTGKPGPPSIRTQWDDEWLVVPAEKERVFEKPGVSQTTLMHAVKVPKRSAISDREYLALELLTDIVNTNIIREIRDRRGLAYAIGASVCANNDMSSYLYMYAETEPKNSDIVRRIADVVLFQEELNSDQLYEIQAAKFDEYMISLELPVQWEKTVFAHRIRLNNSLASIRTLAPRMRRLVNSITVEEVIAAREKYLVPERFVTAIVRPTGD